MNNHTAIQTTGHIKRIDILGADPLTGNLVIELYCGPQKNTQQFRAGAFSISKEALEPFLHQAAAELAETEAATTHGA